MHSSSFRLEAADRVAITKALTELDSIAGDIRDRKVLLEQAGLQRFVSSILFSGSADSFAGQLMSTLEKFDEPLPEEPSKYPLGALLSYLIAYGIISPGKKKLFAEAIVKYTLVIDFAYLERLRSEYNIKIQPSRILEPAAMAPPQRVASTTAPTFTPEVKDRAGLERIINSEDNFLDLYLLNGALACAKTVCRIEGPINSPLGTGVLIGPDLLLTNHHVLPSEDALSDAVARFGYMVDATGVAPKGKIVRIRSDFYYSSPSEELDYALVRTHEDPLAELSANKSHRGFVQLTAHSVRNNERVNIIQHPNGDPMKVVMTQNYVVDITAKRIQYVADTMDGSSGSPVFNRNWDMVALHHSGQPYPPESATEKLKKAWKGTFRVNEGVPTRAILEDLKKKGLEQCLPSV